MVGNPIVAPKVMASIFLTVTAMTCGKALRSGEIYGVLLYRPFVDCVLSLILKKKKHKIIKNDINSNLFLIFI